MGGAETRSGFRGKPRTRPGERAQTHRTYAPEKPWEISDLITVRKC